MSEYEHITFHFEGSLASEHSLNFYEAARFQYATARLFVKLSQFRASGKFTDRITGVSNKDIILQGHEKGSFDISIAAPILMAMKDQFLTTSLSEMASYVFERIVGALKDDDKARWLNSQDKIVDTFGKISSDNTALLNKALEFGMDRAQAVDKLSQENRDLYERMLADKDRRIELLQAETQLGKINSIQESKLLSMATPLVKEMGTAFRKSATTLNIQSHINGDRPRKILFLNQKMADDIDVEIVDKDTRLLIGNIIQYNKETGWGKLRFTNEQRSLSFNVPSDKKPTLQGLILAAMGRDEVNIAFNEVKTKSGEVSRIIIVNILQSIDKNYSSSF